MLKTIDPLFPLGLPTLCFVHLDDGPSPSAMAASDDRGNKVVIDEQPHPVERTFDSRLDKEDHIFQEILEVGREDSRHPVPLHNFVEDSVSVCFILAGTSTSNKRMLYQGPDDSDESIGLVGWVFRPIFQHLREKSVKMQGFYEFEVTVSFYEIYDECITDLLQPENQGLKVKLHPLRGFEVEGLSRMSIKSPGDGVKTVSIGKRNRKTQVMPSGPAQESASSVLIVHLTQREGESPKHYTHLHSELVLVEAPSTHRLISSPDDLRLKQGPTLNRSLLAFKDVS
ncbi:unnamed protein product, partial [Choristocarpus tenellus]